MLEIPYTIFDVAKMKLKYCQW